MRKLIQEAMDLICSEGAQSGGPEFARCADRLAEQVMPTIKIALVGPEKSRAISTCRALAATMPLSCRSCHPHQNRAICPASKICRPDSGTTAYPRWPCARLSALRSALRLGTGPARALKAPGVTVSEVAALTHLARKGVALFVS
jgi:hypothetical protein